MTFVAPDHTVGSLPLFHFLRGCYNTSFPFRIHKDPSLKRWYAFRFVSSTMRYNESDKPENEPDVTSSVVDYIVLRLKRPRADSNDSDDSFDETIWSDKNLYLKRKNLYAVNNPFNVRTLYNTYAEAARGVRNVVIWTDANVCPDRFIRKMAYDNHTPFSLNTVHACRYRIIVPDYQLKCWFALSPIQVAEYQRFLRTLVFFVSKPGVLLELTNTVENTTVSHWSYLVEQYVFNMVDKQDRVLCDSICREQLESLLVADKHQVFQKQYGVEFCGQAASVKWLADRITEADSNSPSSYVLVVSSASFVLTINRVMLVFYRVLFDYEYMLVFYLTLDYSVDFISVESVVNSLPPHLGRQTVVVLFCYTNWRVGRNKQLLFELLARINVRRVVVVMRDPPKAAQFFVSIPFTLVDDTMTHVYLHELEDQCLVRLFDRYYGFQPHLFGTQQVARMIPPQLLETKPIPVPALLQWHNLSAAPPMTSTEEYRTIVQETFVPRPVMLTYALTLQLPKSRVAEHPHSFVPSKSPRVIVLTGLSSSSSDTSSRTIGSGSRSNGSLGSGLRNNDSLGSGLRNNGPIGSRSNIPFGARGSSTIKRIAAIVNANQLPDPIVDLPSVLDTSNFTCAIYCCPPHTLSSKVSTIRNLLNIVRRSAANKEDDPLAYFFLQILIKHRRILLVMDEVNMANTRVVQWLFNQKVPVLVGSSFCSPQLLSRSGYPSKTNVAMYRSTPIDQK